MRSDRVKKGVDRAPHRALLHATGITRKELDKPFIGVCSSFLDLVPGHIGMRRLERDIEKGVHTGGGVSFLFSVPGICDGIAMGHRGMFYSLPSRDLIADMIESVVEAHALDGLVLLTNCDKITPGMLMAAARLNVPSAVVTAGPMIGGYHANVRRSLVRDTFEAVGLHQAGNIDDRELECLEMAACPGGGSCQGVYTANTMACVTEALGMSVPGCATALAASAAKERIARRTGELAVKLVKKDVKPRDIMTRVAFENAIAVDVAIGGSTNVVLHIPAISHEAGVDLPLEVFDVVSRRTPHISNLRPGGEFFMEDLDRAGGIPAVQKSLGRLLADVPTISGKSVHAIARKAEIVDAEVIRPLTNPYHPEGGIAVLRGNLAPDGCVVKQSAVAEDMLVFAGRAVVFDGEEPAMKAVMGGKVKPGQVLVIRYEGPKGGPGMRESLSITAAMAGMGLSAKVSPEAAAGGSLALVKTGDEITIDIPGRKLTLNVPAAEIRRRRKAWKPRKPKITTGWLARYAQHVSSAAQGAILE
jgi:dihydroxy-acid dehydratase